MESVVTNFDFNDIVMTKSSVAKAVDAIAFPQGGTHTSEGLAHVRENIFDAAQGMRESKDGVPRVLVVVTDGQANPGYEPKAEATLLKKTKNVKIFAVGVSNYNLGELRDMSSDPDSEHTIVLKSFDDIFGIVNRMGALSCAEAAVIDNGGPTDTEVDPGTFLYFHPTECDDINADVTVTLKAVSGETRLYMSWSEANPGPLNADHMVETNSATKVVTLARAGHAGDPIYLSVYGVGLTNNEFSLDFTCDEAKATTKAAPTDVPVAVGDNEKSANDPTTDPATGNDADASSNIGAIVGAVVGVLVLLALLLLVGVRRRRGAVGSGGEGALAAHDPSMYNNPLYRQAQDGEKGTSRENLIADDAPTRINTNAVYQCTDSAQPTYENSILAPAAADDQAVYASLASPAAYADVGEANSPEPAYMNAVQEDQSYMHMRSPYNTPNNAPVSEYGSPQCGSSGATC
jgi:MYXO-CTERM domain-containing protein